MPHQLISLPVAINDLALAATRADAHLTSIEGGVTYAALGNLRQALNDMRRAGITAITEQNRDPSAASSYYALLPSVPASITNYLANTVQPAVDALHSWITSTRNANPVGTSQATSNGQVFDSDTMPDLSAVSVPTTQIAAFRSACGPIIAIGA